MTHRLLIVTAIAAVVLSLARPLSGQPIPTGSTIYRLAESSTYMDGCFPPCMCPIMFVESVRGTLRLTYESSDWLFDNYSVTDVNWTVPLGNPELRVTGSGTYRIGGEFALMHQLELDLRVGDEPPQHFDSGLIVGGTEFPTIDITVSMNDMFCLDTVFEIVAAPVPPREIRPYRVKPESTYQSGCWDPCDCPLYEPLPLVGTFALVEIAQEFYFVEYAVVNIEWCALPSGDFAGCVPIDGVGTYRLGGDFVADQLMRLDLSVDGAAPEHFTSGQVLEPPHWPDIDLLLSINGMFCFDQVIDLHAGRSPVLRRFYETTPGALTPALHHGGGPS